MIALHHSITVCNSTICICLAAAVSTALVLPTAQLQSQADAYRRSRSCRLKRLCSASTTKSCIQSKTGRLLFVVFRHHLVFWSYHLPQVCLVSACPCPLLHRIRTAASLTGSTRDVSAYRSQAIRRVQTGRNSSRATAGLLPCSTAEQQVRAHLSLIFGRCLSLGARHAIYVTVCTLGQRH